MAFIYCRISSVNQLTGTSIYSQRELCEKYCNERGFSIINCETEVASAKEIKYQKKLLSVLEYENIELIVLDPSRLSRNLNDFVSFMEKCHSRNITIHFVDGELISTNSMDKKTIVSKIIDSETELNILITRINRSIAFRKRNSLFVPSITKFGYQFAVTKKSKKIVENPVEQKVIRLINLLYHGGDLHEISNLLFMLSGTRHELYDPRNNESIDKIELGNFSAPSIARFLNSIPLYRRELKWTSSAVLKVLHRL